MKQHNMKLDIFLNKKIETEVEDRYFCGILGYDRRKVSIPQKRYFLRNRNKAKKTNTVSTSGKLKCSDGTADKASKNGTVSTKTLHIYLWQTL